MSKTILDDNFISYIRSLERRITSIERGVLNPIPYCLTYKQYAANYLPHNVDKAIEFDNAGLMNVYPDIWQQDAPTKLVAPVSGMYLLFGWVEFTGSPNGIWRQIRITYNNGPSITTQLVGPSGGSPIKLSCSKFYTLNQGDFISIKALQDSGGDLGIYWAEGGLILLGS